MQYMQLSNCNYVKKIKSQTWELEVMKQYWVQVKFIWWLIISIDWLIDYYWVDLWINFIMSKFVQKTLHSLNTVFNNSGMFYADKDKLLNTRNLELNAFVGKIKNVETKYVRFSFYYLHVFPILSIYNNF